MFSLTPLQLKFCLEYAICCNAYEAALKAGYCKKIQDTAKKEKRELTKQEKNCLYRQGSILLSKPKINEKIEELVKQNNCDKHAQLDEIIEYFTTIMRDKKIDVKERTKAAAELLKRYPVGTSPNKDQLIFKRE